MTMTSQKPNSPSYKHSGVDAAAAARSVAGFRDLLTRTFTFHPQVGRVVLDLGYFGNNLGLAISTDGVGTKLLIAQAMNRYDTVGIDCVAMNVNDVLCLGAEPLSLVDYIAVETADSEFISELMKGFYEGAVQANVSIPGGEIAQVKEMIHGSRDGRAFDLVGTCVGLVALDRILLGQNIQPGDVVVGLSSSGIHSNGFTLARRVLFTENSFSPHERAGAMERPLGEELLIPTRIYVKPVLEMLRRPLNIKALAHITGDGLLNLPRVQSETGFVIDHLPEPQPIFKFIQSAGNIPDEEMYYVFNMGIGFCVVLDPQDADQAINIAEKHEIPAEVIGHTVADPERKVLIPQKKLVGQKDHFIKQ